MGKKSQLPQTIEEFDQLVKAHVEEALARERSTPDRASSVELTPLQQNPDLWTTPPRDPEFEEALLGYLDECGGNVAYAADRVLTLARTPGLAPKSLVEQVRRWRTNPKTGQRWDIAPFMEPAFLAAYIDRLRMRRDTESGKSYSAVPTPHQIGDQEWSLRRAAGLLPFRRRS